MATKKKAPKNKATSQKTTEKTLPVEVSREDLLTLQLGVKNVEIAKLREELARLRAATGETQVEAAQKQLSMLSAQANEKYSLVPGQDSFDINTGVITRGTQE